MKRYIEQNNFWVFSHFINKIPVFERSTSCEYRAKERVKELKYLYGYTKSFYCNKLPKKYFY
jgi:hypothetical protein